jgi:ABC-type transport system, involved in lipoprotein release, permease component
MAGTLALIVILSTYNGFDRLVQSLYNTFNSDLLVTPVRGKTLDGSLAVFQQIRQDADVAAYCEVVEETVFLQYRGRQAVGIMKGVDSIFQAHSPLKQHIIKGEFTLQLGDIEQAAMGYHLAAGLGVGVYFIDPLYLSFPRRDASFNPLQPQASLQTEKLFPVGVFSVDQNYDTQYLFVPLATARRLLDYSTECSSLEIGLQPSADKKAAQGRISGLLGSDYVVKNRYQQNETLYKMMHTEKVIIYFLLLFMVLIIACNIIGSLTMLIIEKKDDTETLQSLGANPALIKGIFIWEGWLISALGALIGMVLGLLLCFLQQQFGMISLPGSFAVTAYPIQVLWTDVLAVMGGVLGIGYIAARITAARI